MREYVANPVQDALDNMPPLTSVGDFYMIRNKVSGEFVMQDMVDEGKAPFLCHNVQTARAWFTAHENPEQANLDYEVVMVDGWRLER